MMGTTPSGGQADLSSLIHAPGRRREGEGVLRMMGTTPSGGQADLSSLIHAPGRRGGGEAVFEVVKMEGRRGETWLKAGGGVGAGGRVATYHCACSPWRSCRAGTRPPGGPPRPSRAPEWDWVKVTVWTCWVWTWCTLGMDMMYIRYGHAGYGHGVHQRWT